MRITSTGNVGIGNTNPTGTLCLGNSTLAYSNGFLLIGKNSGSGNSRTQRIGYNENYDLTIGDYGVGTGPWVEAFKLSYNAPANSFVVDGNGNVGIGTSTIPSNSLPTSSATSLFVGDIGYGIASSGDTSIRSGIYIGDGAVAARWRINHGSYNLNLGQNDGSGTYNHRGSFANSTGAYSSISDKRLKKLIEPIQYGLNDVLKFKPVSYLMENQMEDIDKRNLGLIAQDLEYIIPEIVNVPSSSNAVYSLQYTSIIPILIKAIQELNEIVTKNTNTSNMIV